MAIYMYIPLELCLWRRVAASGILHWFVAWTDQWMHRTAHMHTRACARAHAHPPPTKILKHSYDEEFPVLLRRDWMQYSFPSLCTPSNWNPDILPLRLNFLSSYCIGPKKPSINLSSPTDSNPPLKPPKPMAMTTYLVTVSSISEEVLPVFAVGTRTTSSVAVPNVTLQSFGHFPPGPSL